MGKEQDENCFTDELPHLYQAKDIEFTLLLSNISCWYHMFLKIINSDQYFRTKIKYCIIIPLMGLYYTSGFATTHVVVSVRHPIT